MPRADLLVSAVNAPFLTLSHSNNHFKHRWSRNWEVSRGHAARAGAPNMNMCKQVGWKQQLYSPGSINLLVDIVRFCNLNHHLYYIILHKNKAILTQVNSHIADSDKQ